MILLRTCQVRSFLLVSRMPDCKGGSPGACDKHVAQWLSCLGHVLGSITKEGELTRLM